MEDAVKQWSIHIRTLLLFGLMLFPHAKATSEVAITKFVVPPHEERHNNVTLTCEHNLEPGHVYSVQWFFNDEQLYKYAADEVPPKKLTFNESEHVIDLDKSSETKIVLLNVNLSASGVYKCIVMSESPHFRKASKEGNMIVAVIPDGKPIIEPPPSEGLRPGSTVNLNCTALPSKPAATLEWHVNGKKVPEANLISYPIEQREDGLLSSRLGIKFLLKANHFVGGELKLQCIAKIATLYDMKDEHKHQTQPAAADLAERPAQAVGGSKPNSNGGAELVYSVQLLLVLGGLGGLLAR